MFPWALPNIKILENGVCLFEEKGKRRFLLNKVKSGKLIKNRNKKRCLKKNK